MGYSPNVKTELKNTTHQLVKTYFAPLIERLSELRACDGDIKSVGLEIHAPVSAFACCTSIISNFLIIFSEYRFNLYERQKRRPFLYIVHRTSIDKRCLR